MYRVRKEMRIIVTTRLISLLALLVSMPIYAHDLEYASEYNNVFLENDIYTIGAKDYSTGWWTQFSKYYQVLDGEKWVAQFNLSINPAATTTYKNFALIICNDEDRGAVNYKEYGAIRYDYQPSGNSEWGDYIDRSLVTSDLEFQTYFDAGVDKLGGKVTLTVDRSQGGLIVTMTNGTVTKTYNQTAPMANLNADGTNSPIRCFLVPEGSCINFIGSTIEPIGGYTSKDDKLPLSMTLNGVPKKVLQGVTFEEAFASVTATVQFEQSVTKDVKFDELTIEVIPDMVNPGQKTLVAAYAKTFKGEAVNPVIAYAQFEIVDKMYTSIGATDNSTAFWGAHSDNIKVNPGETYVCRFTNYTSGQNNWNNFVVVLCKADNTEYAVVRADNYGWGVGYENNPNLSTSGGQSDWGAWLAAMDGAKVTTYVTNYGDGTADVKAVIEGTNGVNYIQEYQGIAVDNPNDFYFRFTVDNCHLEFDDVVGADDNSTGWWGAHSANFKVPVGQTVTTRIRNYTNGQNNWNNFVVVLTSDGTTEYAVVRADNYGWGDSYGSCTTSGGQSDWGAWLVAMDGALCTISVTNNNGSVDVRIVMEGNDGNTYYQDYIGISPTYGNDVFFRFTVDGSHLIAGITDGTAEIHKKRTIHVATAGTLSKYISESEKYQIENLTLTGELNSTDFRLLRDMAGDIAFVSYDQANHTTTNGKLKTIDMSEINIVEGGEAYNYRQYEIGDGDWYAYYTSDNCFSDYLFSDTKIEKIALPVSVTSIGSSVFWGNRGLEAIAIPNSVTSISNHAFASCISLMSIEVERGNPYYDSRDNCNGIIEKSSNTLIAGCKNTTIPNGVISIGEWAFFGCSSMASVTIPNSVTSIGSQAFQNCSSLTSITIPNSVTSIGVYSFYNCSGLTSVTIPNSVTSIGFGAFLDCKGLTTITSEIVNPFEIDSYTFSDDTYNVAELIVPYGTRATYQNTEGWNKFTMITEAPDKDAVVFTIDGISYEGSKSAKTVVVKAVDTKQTSIEIPASVSYDGITYQVSGITDGVFDGSSMAALIWDVEAALPNNTFSNASIGSNFLLYVKSSSYAPSSIKNVVVDGTAQAIVLSDDGGQFYCPQAFTARRISYSHNYSMETGKGSTMGWESIALPFDVQRIIHSTQGEIVPFAAYSSGSNQKPFWLAYMSAGGFKRTADIRANEAYIIAMPNNSSYQDNYILAGDVTFSAENITVPKTPSFNVTFLPAFSFVAKSSSVYALNVNNRYVRYSGSEKPGSVFIRDLRDVRPFEAYLTGNFTRGIIEINYDNGTTDMEPILLTADDCREMTIHTLSGQKVTLATQRDFNSVWQQLPKGVYIVNGKKLIK